MYDKLATIWKYRCFLMSLVLMDLRTRYRRSILGIGWSLMNPIMMTAVFCVVFGAWFNKTDWRSYGPYFLAGLTLFDVIKTSALSGCQTFFRNEGYIRQCPLPLAIYTLRTVLGAAIHFVIALAVCLLAVLVLIPSQALSVLSSIYILMPALIMLFIFCWSVSLLTSYITIYFQDAQQLLEVIFQVLFFLTPIMFPIQMMVDRGLVILLQINPVVTFLELIREPLLSGRIPPIWCYTKAMIFITVCTSLAILCTAKLERKLIFHL